jgi:hypothetical protein
MANGEELTFRERLLAQVPPRIEAWWAETKATLWFLPTTGTVLAAIAPVLIVYIVVMLHLVRTIERVASLVRERYHDGLVRHLELVKAAGKQGLALGPEREVLVAAVDEAVERIRTLGTGERVPVVPDIIQGV